MHQNVKKGTQIVCPFEFLFLCATAFSLTSAAVRAADTFRAFFLCTVNIKAGKSYNSKDNSND